MSDLQRERMVSARKLVEDAYALLFGPNALLFGPDDDVPLSIERDLACALAVMASQLDKHEGNGQSVEPV